MTNSITRINAVDIVTVEKDGQIFVPVKPICDAIGIAFQPQHIKLQEDDFLAPTVTIIVTVAADGKEREMVCLPLKYTYGWLATINPGKVAPEAREAVTNYRRECYDVLYDHFSGTAIRQQEQNETERILLDRKAAALEAISGHNKAISDQQVEIKKVDDALARLQSERLNPQPCLFGYT